MSNICIYTYAARSVYRYLSIIYINIHTDFYTIYLVCIIIGMFSVYIYI